MFEISRKFKDKLITSILSHPIVYISHFHYNYVDEALRELFPSEKSEHTVLGMRREQILEYSTDGSILDFETKMRARRCSFDFSTLCDVMKDFEYEPQSAVSPDDKFCLFLDSIIAYKSIRDDSAFFEENQHLFLIKNAADFLRNTLIQRKLQTIAAKYERGEYPQELTLILVSPQPVESLPGEVEKLITVVDIPSPTEQEIQRYIDVELPASEEFVNRDRELRISLIRALQGLQHYEIEQIVRSIKVRTGGRLTELANKYALEEKKDIVKKSGIIEVVDTNVSFDQIGGMETLRADLSRKAELFRHLNDIVKMRLPLPKGVLIIGMPGCGKSLIAKSIANEFGISLLRLDINRLMGQYVGQSEANLRKALATAEAAHPCVLWIDEIEKAFAGANGGSNGSTNDIVMRLMGHFLTWMQERKTAVYIVATANDVMRPEFMRKGRFDEVYFVGFPTIEERMDILDKKLAVYQQTTEQQLVFDLNDIDKKVRKDLAEAMCQSNMKENSKDKTPNLGITDRGFSGSEIESVVNAVMEEKYIDYLSQEKKGVHATVKLTKKDFEKQIDIIRPAAMCNQVSQNGKEKTVVERIEELLNTYHFRSASKNK